MAKRKIIVGISGASGSVLALRLLEALNGLGHESHVIISEPARLIMEHETGKTMADLKKLSTNVYGYADFFSSVASGSFRTDGMAIIPCSMKTLAGVASGYSDNLILRAADVCLKERRRLVLVTREMPLSHIHTENMARVSRAGGIILPPVMSFYSKPKGIDDHINHVVGKVLDSLGIDNEIFRRWK
jgi:4-hydroxy-3-polyprenylbenzoate decarboxylase